MTGSDVDLGWSASLGFVRTVAGVTYQLPAPAPVPPPLDPAVQAQLKDIAAAATARRLRRQEQMPAYLALGPELADVDAAVACVCACHPAPPDELHDGGVTCPCQLTPLQRSKKLQELFDAMPGWDGDGPSVDAEVEAEAAQLGVSARVVVSAAPFVICGEVDGRFFYLRSRHDRYTVVIAPNDDPLLDVWTGPLSEGLVVASGPDDDFFVDGCFSAAGALRLAVNAVRVGLRRVSCAHACPAGAWFCPSCGVQLADVLGP